MARSEDTKAALKAHFDALKADIEEVESQSGPLRQERDAIVAEMQPLEDKARALHEKIKEVEAGLYDKKMEYADLARALGGKQMGSSEVVDTGDEGVDDGAEEVSLDDEGDDEVAPEQRPRTVKNNPEDE